MFDPKTWAAVPFHFWSLVLFVFGCMVGSFLNVCIYRMPRGLSVVTPPSHCPHCQYRIPWYLNIPLLTWLWLRGRCAHCRAPISPRYFLVELLTGVLFLASWLRFGLYSPPLALVYCLFLAGLIAATFIDFEHFIIPDEITLGGIAAGFVLSFVVPELHGQAHRAYALQASFWGILAGAGIVYGILRLGKLLFGRQTHQFSEPRDVLFTETSIKMPDCELPFEEIFYRKSDTIRLDAARVELVDRCYWNVPVRLSPVRLQVAGDVFDPEQVPYLKVQTERMVLPREAMGLGDVKFMGAIGAFLGWPATVFSLLASSCIGAVVGLTLILFKRQAWSSKLPYGPYIAAAAAIWVFYGPELVRWLFARAY